MVEHIGQKASSGHYICNAMDSDDNWKCFDDAKVTHREIDSVIENTQAYILFYELIQ